MITSKFFNMGQIVVTRSINEYMNADEKFRMEILTCLERFSNKGWGELDEEDTQTNEDALQYPDDLYLLGAYQTSKGKIWIITNRISATEVIDATTVCFPEER